MRQGARCTRAWSFEEFLSKRESRRVHTGKPTHRHRLDVTFNARDLSGEKDLLTIPHLHRCAQHARRTNIRVAMYLSKLKKFGILQSGNEPQHSRLFAVP